MSVLAIGMRRLATALRDIDAAIAAEDADERAQREVPL